MERWLLNKSNKSSEVPSTSASTPPRSSEEDRLSHRPGTSLQAGENKKEQTRRRHYQKEFLKYGFTCQVKGNLDHPQCVICGDVLANESLKPVKLKRHLETRHPEEATKQMTFFLRKEAALQGQKTAVHEQATLPAKALAASYEVAHLVAKAQKPHTIAESLILPAAIAMTTAMHGEKIASALKQIPLSNDTVSKRIIEIANEMSDNRESKKRHVFFTVR